MKRTLEWITVISGRRKGVGRIGKKKGRTEGDEGTSSGSPHRVMK
jgi:hypothetical protein